MHNGNGPSVIQIQTRGAPESNITDGDKIFMFHGNSPVVAAAILHQHNYRKEPSSIYS